LIRLSVDLRGVHPTEAELKAYENNPAAWESYVDNWLNDPRFVDRTLEVFNGRFLMRTGDTYFHLEDRGLQEVPEDVMGTIISEEPLALLRHIIENDLPYSEIVTAEYTMANPLLAQMWDIDIPGNGGWEKGTYMDGRPHAGMLTMTTTWQRYPSMGGNANRHRANAISKMFMCDDYLSRPIVLNRAAVDQLTVDPENAIATNDGCQSCHSTLDPLAANLFGFFNYDDNMGIEQIVYRQENEQAWSGYAGRSPGYYGRPVSNLTELAQEIADDPRFEACAVRTAFEGYTQRTLGTEDWSEARLYNDAFVESNQSIRELIRTIVLQPAYKSSGARSKELDARMNGLKTASPAQIASIIEGITGYRWVFNGQDGLTTHGMGLPVLAGGIDSRAVVTPSRDPGVATVFVLERLAQSAAWDVTSHDLDPNREAPARMLNLVTVDDTPESSPEAFETQIRALYLQTTGFALADDATEPTALIAVWKEIYSVEASPISAWSGVLSAILRDPRVIFY
ncbi:MAG: hypothetical protein GWP91_24115, partial [Rhodobacterales bacterium]|nr:hypothetical protein [Rhodobacterales bacterium]